MALAVALLLVSGACSPPDALGIGANAAQGLDLFGVRHEADVFVTAGGLCFDHDSTAGKPGPPFVGYQLDVHDETRIADACGTPEDGPAYALAQTRLNESGVWDAHAVAVVAGGTRNDQNGAFALINFVDTFQVVSSDPSRVDGDAAGISMRVPLTATLTNSTSQVSWTVFADAYRVNDDGSSVFLGRAIDSESDRDGTQTRVLETSLPGARIGDRVQIAGSGVFAFAQMGGSRFLLGPEPKRSEVQATFSLCSGMPGVKAISTSGSGATHDCGEGDLELVLAEPVQSVWGTDSVVPPATGYIDLVAAKDSVVRLALRSTFEEAVRARATIELNQPLAGPPEIIEEEFVVPAKPEDKEACESNYYFPETELTEDPSDCRPSSSAFSSFQPRAAFGNNRLVVRAEVEVLEGRDADPTNNSYTTRAIPVKETSLSLAYLRVHCIDTGQTSCGREPDSYGTVSDALYSQLTSKANAWIPAMYPVARRRFSGTLCTDAGDCVMAGDERRCDPPGLNCEGEKEDLFSIWQLSQSLPLDTDRLVGVVPSTYFSFHNDPDLLGLVLQDHLPAVALVREDSPIAAVHELGHTLQLSRVSAALHTDSRSRPDQRPAGYWVGCQGSLGTSVPCEISAQTQDTIVGTIPLSLMDGSGSPNGSPPELWLNTLDYQGALADLRTSVDPPALISVAGHITKSGEISGLSILELEHGRERLLSPGPYALELIDANGNVISSTPFNLTFQKVVDRIGGPSGVEDMSSTVFGFTVPYPVETARARFTLNGSVLLELDPLTESLRDAFERIPERALGPGKSGRGRKKALLNKLDAFEKMLAQGHRRAALKKLDKDIGERIGEWMGDFEPIHSLEIRKDDLVKQIARVKARLTAQLDE